MKKKGELTTQQIIIMIVLIASFVVILFFLIKLNLGEKSQDQLCHNSVMQQASPIEGLKGTPLQCSTNYLCITKDGSCSSADESFSSDEKIKVKTDVEVYEILAQEMANCWWMFGEGQVNYIGSDVFEDLYCSVCSQVFLDDSLKDIFPKGHLDEQYFYSEYLNSKEMKDGGLTYSEYLFSTNDFSKVNPEGKFEEKSFGRSYFIMMGIISESTWEEVATGVGIGAALAVGILAAPFTGGVSTIATIGIITAGSAAGGGAGHFFASIGSNPTGNKFIKPTIIDPKSNQYKDLDCYSIETLS